MNNRGKFIVLEGLDGSGKSTQAQLLQQKLAEFAPKTSTFLTSEPSDSLPGKLCRSALKGEINLHPEALSLLFAGDRIEHIENELLPQLEKGNHIICDRYYYSNFAYQSLNGDIDNVINYNYTPLRTLSPDFTFFINLSPEDCAKRMQENRAEKELFENLETLKKVYTGYLQVFRRFSNDKVIFINARLEDSPEKVSQLIWQKTMKHI